MTGGKTRGVRLFFQKYRVLLGLGLPLTVFAVLAVLIVNDRTTGFDSAIYHVLSLMITPQTTQVFLFLTNLCSPVLTCCFPALSTPLPKVCSTGPVLTSINWWTRAASASQAVIPL